MQKRHEGLGGSGERVLGFAYKELTGMKDDFKFFQQTVSELSHGRFDLRWFDLVD